MRISFILLIILYMSISPVVSGQYKIMVSENYPPYNFYNEDGELVGFNIDIINAISKLYQNEIKIEVDAGEWIKINDALENGSIQGIAGIHLPGTTDEKFSYSRSVANTMHCFLYNRDFNKNFSLEKLRTAQRPKVVLWKNDVLTHYIISINPTAEFIFVSDYIELLDALESEDITCAISQKIAGLYYVRKLGKSNIQSSNPGILERNMGFKISKDHPELSESLNNGIEVIMSNGEYQRIYDKWLKELDKNPNDWRNYIKYFLGIGGIVFITIIILVLINRILQNKVSKRTEDLQHQLDLNAKIVKELEKQKKKAEESDKMKSSFLANMSHEIRTPMNGILGFADLLKSRQYSKEEETQFLEVIEESGERMLSTINNIIDISKIESEVETLEINKVNIENIVLELHKFFIAETKNKGIGLMIDQSSIQQVSEFHSDKYKITSILTNLIKNAIKFTPKGLVSIYYSVTEKTANFKISDTGIGIAPEMQANVFNHFVRANSAHNSGFEGSGLGLSISKGYVDLMKGKIWVESQLNKGTTFHVSIPNNIQEEDLSDNEAIATKTQKSSKLKIDKVIIAEDDNASFNYLKYALKGVINNILHAKNGLKTIELLEQNPDTNVILMDVKMPLLNGIEATRKIRKFNKKVFIIGQTAYAQKSDKQMFLDAGGNEYIVKPIERNRLIELLKHSSLKDS